MQKSLYNAGLTRVNVSFDTLNPNTYKFITKRNYMELAKKGIKELLKLA